MYLLCGGGVTRKDIINKIQSILNIAPQELTVLNLMHLEAQIENIEKFRKNAHEYEYIIFVSPSCIDYVADVIPQLKNTIFLVMGDFSYNYLRKLTQLEILYPHINKGAEGLISEVVSGLDLSNKKTLLVKGSGGNLTLQKKIQSYCKSCDGLDIYHRVGLVISEIDFKNYINNCSGIIVTSSLFATYLFELAKQYSVVDKLQNTEFITWHAKIRNTLYRHGVRKVYPSS